MKEKGKKLSGIFQAGSNLSYWLGFGVVLFFGCGFFFPFWVLHIWKLSLFNNHHVCYFPFSPALVVPIFLFLVVHS